MSARNFIAYRYLENQTEEVFVTQLVSNPSCSGGSLDLVKTNADIEDFRTATGTSSVMLARAAMWNVSVFSKQGLFPVEKVMEEYLKYVSQFDYRKIINTLILN